MKLFKLFSAQRFLQVLIYSGQGAPYALRIDVQRVLSFLSFFVAVLAFLLLGTLMFFREFEISRAFEERLLSLEVANKQKPAAEHSVHPLPSAAPAANVSPPVVAQLPPEAVSPANAVASEMVGATLPTFSPVRARVTDLSLDCQEKQCSASVSMVPSRPGSAQGKLVLVLETQVKRIGTATHTDQTIKRYIVYPGFEELEAITPNGLSSFEGKAFKFSSALQSSITFYTGQSLMPIGLDAYVYDTNGQLITHRRRDADTIQ